MTATSRSGGPAEAMDSVTQTQHPTTGAPGTESYQGSFRELDGDVPLWLKEMREEGISRFAALGFPTPRLEEWKYTNVAPIAAIAFRRSQPADGGDAVREAASRGGLGAGIEVVFVNGRFAPELSTTGALPDGARVSSIATALREDPELLHGRLGACANVREESFTALNAAFLEDGAVIHLVRGMTLGSPIHLLYLTRPDGEAPMSCPRILVIAEESSSATVVESYVSAGEGAYFTNALTEIALGPNAALTHIRIQDEGSQGYHVGTVETRQAASSRFSSSSISLGGALVRTDIRTVFEGEGAEASLDGLYLASGRQHVDHHTTIDHRSPRCASRELYKGVLDDRATAVFNGKVFVRPDAQKSDAQQVNKNLLLSDSATINTKPQLEIFADDVKCSHGATIGRLDDTALFYLRSRGIDESAARQLLIHAFANELIRRIPVESLRDRLEKRLATRWDGEAVFEGEP